MSDDRWASNNKDTILYKWGKNRILVLTNDGELVIKEYRKEDGFWYNLDKLFVLNRRFGDLIVDILEGEDNG